MSPVLAPPIHAGVLDAVSARHARVTDTLRRRERVESVDRILARRADRAGYQQLEADTTKVVSELYEVADDLMPNRFMFMSVTLRRQVAMAHSMMIHATACLEGGDLAEALRYLGFAVEELQGLLGRSGHQARASRSPSNYPNERVSLEAAVRRGIEVEIGFKRLLGAQ